MKNHYSCSCHTTEILTKTSWGNGTIFKHGIKSRNVLSVTCHTSSSWELVHLRLLPPRQNGRSVKLMNRFYPVLRLKKKSKISRFLRRLGAPLTVQNTWGSTGVLKLYTPTWSLQLSSVVYCKARSQYGGPRKTVSLKERSARELKQGIYRIQKYCCLCTIMLGRWTQRIRMLWT